MQVWLVSRLTLEVPGNLWAQCWELFGLPEPDSHKNFCLLAFLRWSDGGYNVFKASVGSGDSGVCSPACSHASAFRLEKEWG